MRADFYLLSRDPAPAAVALLARKSVEVGRKVLVVSGSDDALEEISAALWDAPAPAFLANGMAGTPHDARQLILLGGVVDPANGADFLILADGQWRDPGSGFARVMLLFDQSTIDGARGCWRLLGEDEKVERHFWKQDDSGRWVEGP